MRSDFLSLRVRICAAAQLSVFPFRLDGALSGKCWHNANLAIALHGGTMGLGWALSGVGPVGNSGERLPALYSRWVNHIVWRDENQQLWEVTPHLNFPTNEEFWGPVTFVEDAQAEFVVASMEECRPQPAVYFAACPEGEWTADCLCHAERAPFESQKYWLDRAAYSVQRAGMANASWRVERTNDKINDAWIFA